MSSHNRLRLSMSLIALSALYGYLVIANPPLASAMSPVYIAGVLAVFIVINVWKKP